MLMGLTSVILSTVFRESKIKLFLIRGRRVQGRAGRSEETPAAEGVKDEDRCCVVSHGEVTLMALTSCAQLSRTLAANRS